MESSGKPERSERLHEQVFLSPFENCTLSDYASFCTVTAESLQHAGTAGHGA